jgi:hypothetical protein
VSEYFLHYLWQCQYFNKSNLLTAEGDPLHVVFPGQHNSHAGPDFIGAQLQIGAMMWAGNVEIHVMASEWFTHHHHQDPAYDSVVLHVVWQNDKPVYRADGTLIPTFELQGRVPESLIFEYKQLLNSLAPVPCHGQLHRVSTLARVSALDRALTQRLEDKVRTIQDLYEASGHDLEETCYQLLSRNFGFRINADPFQQLARAVPYKTIRKHGDKPVQVEALLFGQAGFLDVRKVSDAYQQRLRREYGMLASKYSLREARLNPAQWKFMRLRPANFPTVRIAQLATLLCEKSNIFSGIVESASLHELRTLFSTGTTDYWKSHYRFGKVAHGEVTGIGTASIDNILVYTVAPLLAFYSKLKDEPVFMDRALTLLQEIAPEQNAITKLWAEQHMKIDSAFDSQALLQLYHTCCSKRRCLDCAIGNALLKPRAL